MTHNNDSNNKHRYIYATFIITIIVLAGFFIYFYQDFQHKHIELQKKYDELSSDYYELRSRLTGIVGQPSSSLTYNDIYSSTEPSVVKITAYIKGDTGLMPFSVGSGFVYSIDGYIITNSHVVMGADEIEATFLDGKVSKARLVGMDIYSDLAVLKTLLAEDLTPIKLGNSSKLYVGERVLAIGNPYGLSGTMTEGIVSQIGRSLSVPEGYLIVGLIQTDAPINPGNSGGPLLNLQGEVVGVNTAVASFTGEFTGVGLAIPSNLVEKVVTSIIETGKYSHPWLGVQGIDVTLEVAKAIGLKESRGFLITKVLPDTPAEKAGLKGGEDVKIIDGREITVDGDVIIGVDGRLVRGLEDILLYIEYHKLPGDTVSFTILRKGAQHNIETVLGERPPPETEG